MMRLPEDSPMVFFPLTADTRAPRNNPNNLQSYGVLLILQEPHLIITHVSENSQNLLNQSPDNLLGQSIEILLGKKYTETLQSILSTESNLENNPYFLRVSLLRDAHEFDVILHRYHDLVMMEVEPCHTFSLSHESDWLRKIELIISEMCQAQDIEKIATTLVDTIHSLTHMERVMVYRFDPTWNGKVVAEYCESELDPFKGRYFPADDISSAAREYYLAGQMRYLHDTSYLPTRLVSQALFNERNTLDLQYAILRGASPQNIFYLRHFGVRTVLILPLIANQQLWGLVMCHGLQVATLPYALRRLCMMLAQTAGLMIANRIRIDDDKERKRLQQAARLIFNELSENHGRFEYALPRCGGALLESLNATGAVYWNPLEKFGFGNLPSETALDQLIGWLQRTEPTAENYFATDHIASLFPPWEQYATVASGMLVIPLAGGWQSGIAWFKPEYLHHVIWGHNPAQISRQNLQSDMPITGVWVEEVRGKSRPWSLIEIEAVHTLAQLRSHAALKVAEDSLRRSEDRYRRLSAQTSDWYWEQDEEHRLIHTSNTIWEHHGFNSNTVIGLRRWEVGGVQYDTQHWTTHIDSMNHHLPFRDFEYSVKMPNGELCWASITGEPLFERDGKFRGYFGTGTDITLRKKAELALAESEARFRVLADNAPVIIWLADPDGKRTYLNQTWVSFTGTQLETQLGYGWLQSLHPEDLPHIERALDLMVQTRQRIQVEYRIRYHDGTYRWIEATTIPRFSSENTHLGFIGSATDIHERKQLQFEMATLNQNLEDRVQERTSELEAFAYTISHDLRAPLRSIDGYAALLFQEMGSLLNDHGQRYLDRIRMSAQQMAALIDALLHFSRYSLRPIERKTIDMNLLVKEVIRENVPSERQDQILVNTLPDCDADSALLRQVWINLISNALKFTRLMEEPQIRIGVEANAYFIADNGVGFDMQYVNKLFGVFNRLHNDRDFEGTGAGLAIVRRIVERHGGKVWAHGEIGKGATFFFTIPPAAIPDLSKII